MSVKTLPPYDTARNQPEDKKNGIVIVRNLNELQKIWAIRAAVFINDQSCPYREEFDGNDFSGTHVLAYVNGEPVGCLRIRYFADFVKLERLAVLPKFRTSRTAFHLVKAATAFCRQKGFYRFYGHAREGVERFWMSFGSKPLSHRQKFVFSDYNYTEMFREYEKIPNPIDLSASPYAIIAPEGMWDVKGLLEISAIRSPRSVPDRPPK